MDGQHHQCNEHELGQTPGDGEEQRGLACCSPWGRKELDTTGRLNNNIQLLTLIVVHNCQNNIPRLQMLIIIKHKSNLGGKLLPQCDE